MVDLVWEVGALPHIGSACFFCAALFADVLIIRVFLILGMCIYSIGSFDFSKDPVQMHILMFLWNVVTSLFHVYAVYRMVRDERKIVLKNADENAVWRFFYRRGSMSKLSFLRTMKNAEFVRLNAGDVVFEESEAERDKRYAHFYLVVEGVLVFSYLPIENSPTHAPRPDVNYIFNWKKKMAYFWISIRILDQNEHLCDPARIMNYLPS